MSVGPSSSVMNVTDNESLPGNCSDVPYIPCIQSIYHGYVYSRENSSTTEIN